MPTCPYCNQEASRACAPNNNNDRCGIFEGGILFYRRFNIETRTWENRSNYFDDKADFARALDRWNKFYEGVYVHVPDELANRFGQDHEKLASSAA
ncbi:hypothetical protein PUR29_34900 [Methylobacterium ajmalii]|uniref:Uncharacterized protein n=1 Tax=Methylobacterium ajmalii TaxID=2738439 RepID=A0ABV0A5W7_9HYPH